MIRTVETRDVNAKADRQWVAEVWSSRWGGDVMVTRGRTHRWDDLPAVVAVKDERISGVAVYRVAANGCELVSLDAIDPRQGIGTTLLAAVEDRAARVGSCRVWLITTNDNLGALRFYQRRGYRIVAVHAGAVDEARRVKPAIPLRGDYGIPLHDEVELEKRLRD